jgi:hypothetical protein
MATRTAGRGVLEESSLQRREHTSTTRAFDGHDLSAVGYGLDRHLTRLNSLPGEQVPLQRLGCGTG